MQTLSPGLLALLAFLAEPFGAGTAPPRTLASRGWAAPVRHAKDGDGRWWPRATSLAPFSGRAPTGAEAGLRGGQGAGAAVAALPPLAQQRLGRVSVLAADPASVTVAHDDALAPCMPAAPLGGPAVTDLVQGALGQHRTGRAPLGRPCLRLSPLPIFPHARFAPRAHGADDALVPKAVRDARHPPGLGKRLVPPAWRPRVPRGGCALPAPPCPPPRGVRGAAWSGARRDAHPRLRVDGVAPRASRPLDAVVLQRRLAAGPRAPRGLGEGHPRDGGSRRRSPLAPVRQCPPGGGARRAVGGPCRALHARGGGGLEAVVGLPPAVAGVERMPQRRHPQRASLGGRPAPVARDRAARPCVRPRVGGPALPWARALPATTAAGAAGACWCGRAPGSLGAGASRGLWHGPTPCVRASRSGPCGAPCGPCGAGPGPTQSRPRPAHEVSVQARGLRPRQGRVRLAEWRARCGLPRVRSAAAPRGAMAGLPTRPARAPANASRTPFPRLAHDAGPVWLARPALSETCTPSPRAGWSRHTRTPAVSRARKLKRGTSVSWRASAPVP